MQASFPSEKFPPEFSNFGGVHFHYLFNKESLMRSWPTVLRETLESQESYEERESKTMQPSEGVQFRENYPMYQQE